MDIKSVYAVIPIYQVVISLKIFLHLGPDLKLETYTFSVSPNLSSLAYVSSRGEFYQHFPGVAMVKDVVPN